MGEGKLAMFGKTFDTVGSTDSNFVIKTKGDLKVQYGNKFIDLIKNGKLNVDSDFIFLVKSEDSIKKNGIYVVQNEEDYLVYVCINGTKIPVNSNSKSFVSFVEEQEHTAEEKQLALINIGLQYNSIDEAKEAGVTEGLIYSLKEQRLYSVKDGVFTDYSNSNSDSKEESSTQLELGKFLIKGGESSGSIDSPNSLTLLVNSKSKIIITDNINAKTNITVPQEFSIGSENATQFTGYRLYIQGGESFLDIDNINLRGNLNKLSQIEVSYEELIQLITEDLLITGKEYRIKDFQNSWEATTLLIYNDQYDSAQQQIQKKNVRPLVIKARSKNTLELNSYYYDYPEWILHYNYTYNGVIQVLDSETGLPTTTTEKGRVVYLKDEYNNEANYDFKHLKFFINDKWYYTFSNNEGVDDSLDGNYYGNSVIIKDVAIANQDFVLSGTNKLAIINPVSNNSFKNYEGSLVLEGNFNNNIVHSKWERNTISNSITNCEFIGNVIDTVFSQPLNECVFKYSITNTDIFTKAELNNCQVNNNISGSLELPDSTLLSNLKSLEPKQVGVVVKDSKQYLSITSDTLLSLPSGVILMWAGTKNIPYGWAVCDGKNGTPNLLGRFIKAVGTSDEIGEIESELNNKNELTLKQENLPKHSHPHNPHTHEITLGNITATAEKSGSLQVQLNDNDYNFGIEVSSKTVVTAVTGEGVTTETALVDGVSMVKTKGGLASGGDHSHTVKIDASGKASLKESTSQEQTLVDSEWPNKAIKIEPRSYALLFIMKL